MKKKNVEFVEVRGEVERALIGAVETATRLDGLLRGLSHEIGVLYVSPFEVRQSTLAAMKSGAALRDERGRGPESLLAAINLEAGRRELQARRERAKAAAARRKRGG